MTNGDEDPFVYNMLYEAEVLIDRPAAQVWSTLLDDTVWVTTHDIEAVSGEFGKVGFITRVSPKAESIKGTPPPHYGYCKVIKLVPNRQQVLKSYPERGGSFGVQWLSFYDTRLVAVGQQTKVIFNVYSSGRGGAVPDPAAQKEGEEINRDGMIKNLNNLKRIVESQ